MAVKSGILFSKSTLRLYKQNLILKFMATKTNEPRLTQKQICNQLTSSDSTIKRFRDVIQMDGPYKRNENKKKKNQPNTTITQTQSQKSNENKKKY